MLLKRGLAERTDTQVAFMGSSHVYYGVNPEHLTPRSVNLAYPSQSLQLDDYIFRTYADSMIDGKYLFLEIAFFLLPYSSEHAQGGVETTLYRHFWNFDDIRTNSFLKNHFAIASVGISNSIRRGIRHLRGEPPVIRSNRYGWAPRNGREDLDSTAKIDANRHNAFWSQDPAFIRKNLRYLGSMITVARKAGIEPVLLSTPKSMAYRSLLDPGSFKTYENITDSLSRAADIDFLDFSNDPRFEDAHFSDSDHLTPEGATLLTQMLNLEIARLDSQRVSP